MQAKDFLTRKGVEFDYIEMASLSDPLETIRAITGGHVATPVVVIGEEHLIGFDPDWLEARLGEE